MKYIDKSILRQHFDVYTRKFLRSRLGMAKDVRLESRNEYKIFNRKRYKKSKTDDSDPFNGWLSILMKESDSKCCYCMRRIDATEVSVEHLVPESFEGLSELDEMQFYERHASALRDHLMTGREFDELVASGQFDIATHERMPHLVAHVNLFPACNKAYGCSCNNERHNGRILPMMLMPDVDQWTRYREDGTFELFHSDIDAATVTLENLALNNDTLKKVRKLWYLFTRKGITPSDAADSRFPSRDLLIRKALDLGEDSAIPEEFGIFLGSDPFYWQHMLKYDWFYDYYRSHYPLKP